MGKRMVSDKPSTIEHYEKKFGIIAVEIGFITEEYLAKALAVQAEDDRKHLPHRLLGKIFFDMALMTDKQVEEVVSRIFINEFLSDMDGDPQGKKKRKQT